MSLLDKVKDALVPQTDRGIVYECTVCGATFEEAHERCPECGSSDIVEQEGFEMRPNES